jgi:hypothetical protein
MTHLTSTTLVMAKKKGRESNWQFDSQPQKSGIDPSAMHVGGMQHTVGKLSMRAAILL